MGLFNWWRQERPPYWAEIRALTNERREEQGQARASLEAALRSSDSIMSRAATVALVSSGVGWDLLTRYYVEKTWEPIWPTLFQRVRRCLFTLTGLPAYIDIELDELEGEVTATVKGSPSTIVVTLGSSQLLSSMWDKPYATRPSDKEIDAKIVVLIQTATDAVLAQDALSRLEPTASYRDFKKVVEELRGMVAP